MKRKTITENQREEEILREIQAAGGTCRVSFLARQLDVTSETIRRNIRNLENRSIVRKVHGGVHLVYDIAEPSFERRMDVDAKIKRRLARTVAKLIRDGDSVFLDIGSSTAYVAMELCNHSNLLVVTNSVFVANILATRNNNRVFLAGGELRSHDGGAFGAEALELVERIKVRVAIFSIGAVNGDTGFMLHDLAEANIARRAANNARTRIIVTASEKFGKQAPVAINYADKIDMLITDSQPPEEIMEFLERSAIDVIVSDDE